MKKTNNISTHGGVHVRDLLLVRNLCRRLGHEGEALAGLGGAGSFVAQIVAVTGAVTHLILRHTLVVGGTLKLLACT